MKSFCEFLLITFIFNIINSDVKLANKKYLQKSLSHLLQKLISPEETLQFIYDDSKDCQQLTNISNPYSITHINESIRGSLKLYNTYVIFTTNHTSFDETLTKLQQSNIWNPSNSPRGKFILVTSSYIDTRIVSDIFHKYGIVKFSLLRKLRYQKYYKSGKSIILSFNIQDQEYLICYTSIPTIEERAIKMILPYPVNLSTTKAPEFKAIFGLGLYFLNIIGEIFQMEVSQVLTNDTATLMYNKSSDIYVLLSTTRDVKLYEEYDVCNYLFRDIMAWAVPAAENISTFKTIANTLDVKVWLAIIAILIAESILWWLFSKSLKTQAKLVDFETCTLSSFFITLGGSSQILPKTNSLRVLLVFYLFYSMQVSTIFQGKLFSGLTDPNLEHGITTMEELTESSLPMIGSPKTKDLTSRYFSNDTVLSKILTKLIVQHPINMTNNLINIVRFRNCSTLMGKAMLYYCYPGFKPLVHLIERNTGIIEFELNLAIKKGHYFLEILNKFSRRVMESGINSKMFSDATAGYSNQVIENNAEENLQLHVEFQNCTTHNKKSRPWKLNSRKEHQDDSTDEAVVGLDLNSKLGGRS
ncbi:hypothetical protein ILUMI_12241 [Ignelater luminosus]|uniref:Ionotropic receptor n=1 Tax=Ignelater luminosus TaxID=2038154 RepID=A0A8K0CYJ5_IGNLU|nr:hypothetical protein ILUMI_12241 [Ignelater luminosus]